MGIVITDMTVCEGGNHVTLFVSEDGGEARALPEIDIAKLNPDLSHAEVRDFMNEVAAEDVEAVYSAVFAIRTASARTFDDMRHAVLLATGAPV